MPITFGQDDPVSSADYTWDMARQDEELLQSARRYYKNIEGKVFTPDAAGNQKLFDYMVSDRRWKDAFTPSTLKELNRVSGGFGNSFLSKQDLQDLSVIRSRWEKLPGGFENIAKGVAEFDPGKVGQGVGQITANVARGIVDPINLVGGVAGKVATKAATKTALSTAMQRGIGAGTAIGADVAISSGANIAYQKTNVEVGIQDEIDPWGAIVAGTIGGAASAPGAFIVSAPKKDIKPDVKLALEQTRAADGLKKQGITRLFSDKELEKVLPPSPQQQADTASPPATTTEFKYPVQATLSSRLGLKGPKLQSVEKRILDYMTGNIYSVKNTQETQDVVKNVAAMISGAGAEDVPLAASIGKTTVSEINKAAQKGLEGASLAEAAQKVLDLPSGYTPSAVESAAAEAIRQGVIRQLQDESDPQKIIRLTEIAMDLTAKDIEMGSEQGRALAMRRFRQYTPMDTEALRTKVFTSIGDTFGISSKDTATRAAAKEQMKNYAEDVQFAIKSLMEEGDPLKVDLFLTNLENQKSKTTDAWWEAWYNSLLSNPTTQIVNFSGNAAIGVMKTAEDVYATASSGVNPGHVLAAYAKAIPEAWSVFKRTFQTEIPNDLATRLELKESQAIPSFIFGEGDKEFLGARFRQAGVGEKGWGGRQVRIPGRALMAFDDFFKTIHYRAGTTNAAIQEILSEGADLSSEQFIQELTRRTALPSEGAQQYARDLSRVLTLTSPGGPISTAFSQIVDEIPLGRAVVPFVRTPGNILKYAADMTIPVTKRNKEDFAAGGLRKKQAEARIAMGWLVMATGSWAGATGLATGAGPTDPAERNVWMADNLPWALKFGNTQVQFNRLDPVAIPFAVAVGTGDLFRSLKDPTREHAFLDAATLLFSDALLEKTWFQGVQNVMDALTGENKGIEGFTKGLARTFVPSVVAGTARAFDPRTTAPQTLMEVMYDRVGFDARKKVPTKLDVFGREVNIDVLGATGEYEGAPSLVRMLSPFKTKQTSSDPVVREVDNLRMRIAAPPKKWRGVELDSEQYYILSKARGKFLYDGIKFAMQDPAWNSYKTGQKRMIIDSIKEYATETSNVILWGTYPELIQLSMKPKTEPTLKKFIAPTKQELMEEPLYKPNPKLNQ